MNRPRAHADDAVGAVACSSDVRASKKAPDTPNQAQAEIAGDIAMECVPIKLGERNAVLAVEVLNAELVLSGDRGAFRKEVSLSNIEANMCHRIRHSSVQPGSAR